MAQNNAMVRKGKCLNIGNCNKANSKEIVDVNIGEDFVCPDCGGDLVEVKPTTSSLGLIIGGIVLALAIVGASVYFFVIKGDDPAAFDGGEVVVVDSVDVDTDTETEAEDTTTLDQETPEEVIEEVEPVKRPVEIEKPAPTGGVVTKDLGYAVWIGKMKNGKPHDVQGTLKFKTNHIIDTRDDKGRTAGPGDQVIGTFEDGHLTNGKWYKADGNVESIILGGI